MKKQIIAAAVAASVSAVAMADISINGDAKYEYLYTDNSDGTTTNQGNTEMHLNITGKTGDTTVVIKTEIDTSETASSSADAGDDGFDIEDMYLTTKVGDITVKGGSWASGTTALLGEIDNGSRTYNRVELGTSVAGVKLYAGNVGRAQSEGFSNYREDMYAGAQFSVAGQNVHLKRLGDDVEGFGLSGETNGLKYRVEQKNGAGTNTDVTFAEIGTTVNGMGISYAMIDADAANLVGENDSSIFAVEMGLISATTEDAQQQVTVNTSLDGNALTFKMGTIENGISSGVDLDYTQLAASRPLASGAKATVTWTDKDTGAASSTETFEIDLSVSF